MKKIFSLIALHLVLLTFAQPGSLDTSFNPTDSGYGNGASSNEIYDITIQTDGKIIIGGDFTYYRDKQLNRIARLDANGSRDTSFDSGSGANNIVYATAVQADGKIIIGGDFTSYNGAGRNRITRVNADGSIDQSFSELSGANGTVRAIAVQTDGKILIGGSFTSYNNKPVNRIARLNADGSLDTSFDAGTGANNSVSTIKVQADGKILVGGYFTVYKGAAIEAMLRLNPDGSLDNTFISGYGTGGLIKSISVQQDGKILIAGWIGKYNNISIGNIARLNADGSFDYSFNSAIPNCNDINSIGVQPDGKIIIGGSFCSGQFARLNTDGSLDATFNVYTDNKTIYSLEVLPDGKILIGGYFKNWDGNAVDHIACLNLDGSLDTTFNMVNGANAVVKSIAVQPDDKIIIGGDFRFYNKTSINRIARLNTDGSLDNSFNPGTGVNKMLQAIALQADGKILIGGDFTVYNGTARNRIARLTTDGSLDSSFNPGSGADNNITNIAIQTNGKIIIAGDFETYNGIEIKRIARLNTDGSLDTTFVPGILILGGQYGGINTIALQSDGKILIGGCFSDKLVRLNTNGSIDTSFKNGEAASGCINSVAVKPNGQIIIGGDFTYYGNAAKNYLAMLNADGSLTNFNYYKGPSSQVTGVYLEKNGRILIVGGFTNMDGFLTTGMASLEANGTVRNVKFYGYNESVAFQMNGDIMIAGNFTSYNGIGRNRIARIKGTSSSLGINDSEFAKSIQLYPNPVSDILAVETQEDITPEVEIYDILGNSVKRLTSFDKRVDVSSLPSGVYIINITDGKNGVYRSKFVKK